MRILVVDDDELILRSLERLLKSEHEVVRASSAEDAFREIAIEAFDAILCDVQMPNVSGMAFASRLSPLDAERLIFISGDALPDDAGAFGGHAYLPKPFTRNELFAAIHHVCGAVRLRA